MNFRITTASTVPKKRIRSPQEARLFPRKLLHMSVKTMINAQSSEMSQFEGHDFAWSHFRTPVSSA